MVLIFFIFAPANAIVAQAERGHKVAMMPPPQSIAQSVEKVEKKVMLLRKKNLAKIIFV